MENKKIFLDEKNFYLIYFSSLIPILIFLFDFFFLNIFNNFLKNSPRDFLLYLLIFDLPHVLSSFLMLFDKDYYKQYKKKINYSLFVILSFLMIIISQNLLVELYIIVGFFTMYHVIKQQYGICKIYGNKLDFIDKTLEYILVVLTGQIFCEIYFNLEKVSLNFTPYKNIIIYSILLLIIIVLIKSIIFKKDKTRHYFFYIFTVFLSLIFYIYGYYFLAILNFRIIHDISAFYIYSTHNYNRKIESKKNIIFNYSFLKKISPVYLTILIPLILNSLFLILLFGNLINDLYLYFSAIHIFLAITHYQFEGFFWKRNTIARKNIPIKKFKK